MAVTREGLPARLAPPAPWADETAPPQSRPWRTPFRWARQNLFGSLTDTAVTLLMLALLATILPPLFRWLFSDATLAGNSRADCNPSGACWAFIRVRFETFFYGRYPVEERWRVDLAALVLALFTGLALRSRLPAAAVRALLLVTLCPVIIGVLLAGGVAGLPPVPTDAWGGLMLNVVLTFTAVAAALPLGVLLALGRRSRLPLLRWLSVGYIEFWRGVPLLTVLFMAMVMLPMFLPGGMTLDRLLRAMIGLTLFTAAYMAEIVRGGLQGVPRGQEEAARALGLGYWRLHVLVVLPQAFRLVVPGIVNTVIDLFKDTTLVSIVGLFDLLGIVGQALKDPNWLALSREGYVFAAAVFFVCCFAMSLYSRRLEHRLLAFRRR